MLAHHSHRTPTRPPRAAALSAALALTAAGLITTAAPAYAAPLTDAFSTAVTSPTVGLGGFHLTLVAPTAPLTYINADVTANATWSGSFATTVGWDSDLVRQGRTATITRVAPSAPGHIDTRWTLSNITVNPLGLGDIHVGNTTLSKDNIPCSLNTSGAGYQCTAASDDLTLVETPGVPLSPYVKLRIEVAYAVTPTGVVVTRQLNIGGSPITGPNDLSLTDTPQSEAVAFPCNLAAGDHVTYALDPFGWTPTTAAHQQPAVVVGLMDPVLGVAELPAIVDAPIGPAADTSPTFDLAGPGHTTDLGALQKNNVAPTLSVTVPGSGDEGTPVAFSASATGPCAAGSTYAWTFSDGGHAFGANPQHTFTDSGVYTGTVTVTDSSGLTASQDFSLTINNLPPTVSVAPNNPTLAWGRPLTLSAQAVDPGAGDQATLTYAWTFGDGSSDSSGGPSETHTWSTPGDYAVTVTVCDNDGACTTAPVTVHVRARTTAVSYTGDNTGTYSATTTLAASLVDEFGQPVTGRAVTFSLDGSAAGSALTNSAGNASRSYVVPLPAGTGYPVTATFGGDALYDPSGPATESYDVAPMATSLAYTGSTTGGPNKTVPVSAALTDVLGRVLAGEPVTITLGSQTVSGITDATGSFATTLKLSQKPGTYPITVSWPGEVGHYSAATTNGTFHLNKK